MRLRFLAVLLACAPAFAGYSVSRSITVDHTKVGGSLSNFPMEFSGTYSWLATTAHGGGVVSASGYDIVFGSSAGCPSILNFERVVWSATSGTVEFHVSVPSLSSTTDTVIYICYGNSSVNTDQQNAAATWDANYKGVWHLSNGTVLNMTDSTANGNNGTTSNATAGSGQIDGAGVFSGSGGINMGQTASLQSPSTGLTISAWVYPSTLTQSGVSTILAQDYSNPRGSPWWSYYLSANDPSCAANAFAAAWATSSSQLNVFCSSQYSIGQWYYLTFTFDGGAGIVYVNGSSTGAQGAGGSIAYSNGSFDIGSDLNNASTFTGSIDEVRVSNVVRSAQWISTEYANQSSPSTFYSISDVGSAFANIL